MVERESDWEPDMDDYDFIGMKVAAHLRRLQQEMRRKYPNDSSPALGLAVGTMLAMILTSRTDAWGPEAALGEMNAVLSRYEMPCRLVSVS